MELKGEKARYVDFHAVSLETVLRAVMNCCFGAAPYGKLDHPAGQTSRMESGAARLPLYHQLGRLARTCDTLSKKLTPRSDSALHRRGTTKNSMYPYVSRWNTATLK